MRQLFVNSLLLAIFICNNVASQTFVTVDKDTYEFVEDVNYSLYNSKQLVYKGVTPSDKATTIKPDILYDSIVFSRVDYKTLGLLRTQFDSLIFLSKKTFYLDEVVIGSKMGGDIILGETNRFIKRRSRPFLKELGYGVVLTNSLLYNLKLDKAVFYVDKVKLRTAYRINFMQFKEVSDGEGHQHIEPGRLIYRTDILYLNPKDKGKVEVSLGGNIQLIQEEGVFVWIELIDYYNEDGVVTDVKEDEWTRLKFQMSKQLDYYSHTVDLYSNKSSTFMVNTNLWLKHDYLRAFFKTPHKSMLITPAIVLYAKNANAGVGDN